MDWFIARNGKPVGPLTFDALVDAARRGQLNQEDYVWQPGGETWERADSVAALWDHPPRLPLATHTSALVHKKRRPWLRIVALALAISGALLASGVAGIEVSELMFSTKQSLMDAGHARPIKRDCALNEYLQGRCH
jgi:uncharacterized protein DUF4339